MYIKIDKKTLKILKISPRPIEENNDSIVLEKELSDYLNIKVVKDGNFIDVIEKTPEEIANEKKAYIAKEKATLKKELLKLCEQKLVGARSLIANQPATPALIEEYKRKQEAIINEDVDFFNFEAQIQGTTAQEEYDKAKAAAPVFKEKDDYFIKLIAAARRGYLKKLNDNNDIELLRSILKEFYNFDKDTTIEDLKEILNV